ncbi:unnamed protein product [Dicrocoelium dendriticum]|nr:unnamed protein product [Dicrocoelium dendriticum]
MPKDAPGFVALGMDYEPARDRGLRGGGGGGRNWDDRSIQLMGGALLVSCRGGGGGSIVFGGGGGGAGGGGGGRMKGRVPQDAVWQKFSRRVGGGGLN